MIDRFSISVGGRKSNSCLFQVPIPIVVPPPQAKDTKEAGVQSETFIEEDNQEHGSVSTAGEGLEILRFYRIYLSHMKTRSLLRCI